MSERYPFKAPSGFRPSLLSRRVDLSDSERKCDRNQVRLELDDAKLSRSLK